MVNIISACYELAEKDTFQMERLQSFSVKFPAQLTPTVLIAKVHRFCQDNRQHHARTCPTLSLETDAGLHALLDDFPRLDHARPLWPEFMANCIEYCASMKTPEGGPEFPGIRLGADLHKPQQAK